MNIRRIARAAGWLVVGGMVLGVVSAALPASAQTIRAILTGTVLDSGGGIVQGATVTATNVATNITSVTKTNQTGSYTFPALAPGEYVVDVSVPGFKRNVQSGVMLQIAQATRLDVSLEVGGITEEVRVVTEAPLVRSTSSELGQVIDYKQIQSLPLNGRLFQQLITLSPGALPRGFADFAENPAAAGARSAVHHSVNGLPWSGNNYLLDGVANNEPLNAFINVTPPLEAIQEFKVQTNNPTAEFGVFGGAVVNLSIRSGTNRFSGSVFEYYRDDALNARNFFAVTKAPFNSDQFGFTSRRPHRPEPRVLLRRLPGTAAGSGPHDHHDRTDRRHAPRGILSAIPGPDLRPAHRPGTSRATSSRPAGSIRSSGKSSSSTRSPLAPAWRTTTWRTTWCRRTRTPSTSAGI